MSTSADVVTNAAEVPAPGSRASAPVTRPLSPPDYQWSCKMTWDEWCDARARAIAGKTAYPVEEIGKYRGKTIALSPDETTIRAVGEDFGEVWDRIVAEGDEPHIYIFYDVPVI